MALISVDDYLFERYLKATEYTVDCYLDRHGKAISVVPRVRLKTQGGESIRSKTVSHTGVESLSNVILAQDEFRGPITIQILEDQKTNQLFAMEVNLRFGGGVLTSIAAGADSADFLFADYLGESLMPVTDWEPNLLMMRTFREYYISCN